MPRYSKHLTFANICSALCLLLLVGFGTAHAAGLANDSVKSKQIKNGQVKTVDLKNNAVKGSKVAANSLSGADIDESSLTGTKGYSVVQSGTQTINTNHHVQNTIISKTMPAGSYIVTAQAVLIASDDTNDSFADVECRLGDGTTTATSKWLERLGGIVIVYGSTTTTSLTTAVSSATPVTVTLSCSDEHDSGQTNFTESVSNARITAVQTSSNN